MRSLRGPLLGLAASLFCLLGLEAGVRIAAPQWSDAWKMWRIDPVYARGLRASVRGAVVHAATGEFAFRFSTNAQGLRMDRELAARPAPGAGRLLLVGDSFTFGYGVDQGRSFADRLQARIPDEVVNAGFASGFGLDTEYLFTREVGAAWQPSRVLVGVCLSNDLDDLGRTQWTLAGERLVRLRKTNDWVPALVKRSGLVNLLVKGVFGPGEWRDAEGERLQPACAADPAPASTPGTTAAVATAAEAAAGLPEQRAAWLLQSWAAEARAAGYALDLLLIPDAAEVQWPATAARRAQHARVRGVFEAAAAAAGVRVLDPLPSLREHFCRTGEKLYFDRDGHWNEAGHRFVGEWLAQALAPGAASGP